MRQLATAIDGVKMPTEIGAPRTRAGSFDALCVSYYRSPDFLGLKTTTQSVRRNIIERFRALHGSKPLKGLRRTHIKEIIGAKAETPEAANNLLKVLHVLLDYAVDQEMIDSNPATGVKRYRSRGDGIHTWSEEEIAQFESQHAVGTRARLCCTRHKGAATLCAWASNISAATTLPCGRKRPTARFSFRSIHRWRGRWHRCRERTSLS
jgi:hypothetical protein